MYRCVACDHPSQMGCARDCPSQQEMPRQYDPWGWREEESKLDIQAGVRVNQREEEFA